MKKILIVLAILMFLPAAALAVPVIIQDPTGDARGGSKWESFSITVDTNPAIPTKFIIQTKYPQYSDDPLGLNGFLSLRGPFGNPSAGYADVADLMLDRSGNGSGWDYAIPLVPHDNLTAGQVYEINSFGIFNSLFNESVPDRITAGTPVLGAGTWAWKANSNGSDATYRIVYSGANWTWDVFGQEAVRIFWATASCKNDIIDGVVPPSPVPEPATMLLLGSGLVGLAGFGRKKLFNK